MNYFLLLVVIGLGAGGYFGFMTLQDKQDSDVADLKTKIEALEKENQKLEDANKLMNQNLLVLDRQNGIGSGPALPAAPIKPTSNLLGTIVTPTGKTYQNCRLLKVEPDGIVVNHSEGIMKFAYALLPDEMQKRFGYDLKQGLVLTTDQVQAAELQRQTAGD